MLSIPQDSPEGERDNHLSPVASRIYLILFPYYTSRLERCSQQMGHLTDKGHWAN